MTLSPNEYAFRHLLIDIADRMDDNEKMALISFFHLRRSNSDEPPFTHIMTLCTKLIITQENVQPLIDYLKVTKLADQIGELQKYQDRQDALKAEKIVNDLEELIAQPPKRPLPVSPHSEKPFKHPKHITPAIIKQHRKNLIVSIGQDLTKREAELLAILYNAPRSINIKDGVKFMTYLLDKCQTLGEPDVQDTLDFIKELKKICRNDLANMVIDYPKTATVREPDSQTLTADITTSNNIIPKLPANDRSDTEMCAICFEKPRTTVTIPCNHMATCSSCSLKITACCICRRDIAQRIDVYIS